MREQRSVNFLGGMRSGSSHDDPLTILLPLQYGARREAELAPNLSRHRDLPLGGQLG